MWNFSTHRKFLLAFFCCVCVLASDLLAQNRFTIGVYTGPQASMVRSEEIASTLSRTTTTGGSGMAVGFDLGAFVEYEVLWNLYLRGGLTYARKRFAYDVTRTLSEQGNAVAEQNRVVYTAIEVPVAIVYRFPYLRSNDRFLVGVGGVVNRWFGDPQIDTPFLAGSEDRDYIQDNGRALVGFVGYDLALSDRFVFGVEPYVAYSPTSFTFETESVAEARWLGGIRFRLRFEG